MPVTNQVARSKSSSRPKLREIAADDFAEIASFTESFGFDPMRSRAEWEHLWLRNPANAAFGMRCPPGWLLEVEGRIVGHIASIPTLYRLGNRQLLCVSGRAWAVVEEYRGYSQLMLHQYLQQSGIDLALTNTANLLSCRVHVELGAGEVPVGEWDRSPAWITGYSDLLADLLARKSLHVPRLLLYPASAVLAAKDRWNRLRVAMSAGRNLELDIGSAFDGRFDQFWEQLCLRYPNKLLADRSLRTLQWHFHYAMAEGRLWILTASRQGQLLAYAVFVRDAYRTAGSTIHRVVLADFQALDRDDGIYFTILRTALKHCRANGVALLVTNGFSASGTDTSRFAPYRRKLPNPRFLYKATNPQLAKLLAGSEAWCPSPYDADDTL